MLDFFVPVVTDPAIRASILKAVDQLCALVFKLLSSGPTAYADHPDVVDDFFRMVTSRNMIVIPVFSCC